MSSRVWFNGRIGAFQAFDGGSIPPTRSKGVTHSAFEDPTIICMSVVAEELKVCSSPIR